MMLFHGDCHFDFHDCNNDGAHVHTNENRNTQKNRETETERDKTPRTKRRGGRRTLNLVRKFQEVCLGMCKCVSANVRGIEVADLGRGGGRESAR